MHRTPDLDIPISKLLRLLCIILSNTRAGDTGDRGIKSFAETENIYNHHHQSVSGLVVRSEVQIEVYVMEVWVNCDRYMIFRIVNAMLKIVDRIGRNKGD